MDTLDFSDFFNTKPQADDFAQRMSMISAKIFETSFNPHAALLEQFGISKRDAFLKLLRENNVNAESRKAIKDFIDKMLSQIASMKVLSLILAFEPTDETLKLLSRWFVLNTKSQALFDIKVDTKIIAGAAIMANGKYLDFSIKPKFDEIFNQTMTPQSAQKPQQLTTNGSIAKSQTLPPKTETKN